MRPGPGRHMPRKSIDMRKRKSDYPVWPGMPHSYVAQDAYLTAKLAYVRFCSFERGNRLAEIATVLEAKLATLKSDTPAWRIANAHASRYRRLARAQVRCAESAVCRIAVDAYGAKTLLVANAYQCRSPRCPWCARLRRHRTVTKLIDGISRAETAMPGLKWVAVVFTMRPTPLDQIGLGVTRLHNGVANLAKEPRWRAAVHGLARTTEMTINVDARTAHVHCHGIAAMHPNYFDHEGLYISNPQLQAMWRAALGDPQVEIVHISRVRGWEHGTDSPQFRRSLLECCHYMVSPDSIPSGGFPATIEQLLTDQLHARHMFSLRGIMAKPRSKQ